MSSHQSRHLGRRDGAHRERSSSFGQNHRHSDHHRSDRRDQSEGDRYQSRNQQQSGSHQSSGYGHHREDNRSGREWGRTQSRDDHQRGQSGRSNDRGSGRGWNSGGYGQNEAGSSGFGRGRGGNRGRRGSPVRLDVRQIARTVEPLKDSKAQNRGTEGKEVELISNLYPAQRSKNISVYHYDIEISVRKRDGTGLMDRREEKRVKNERKVENKQIIDKMAVEWPQVLRLNSYVFDGNKNLFTAHELDIGSDSVTRVVTITLDGFPEQTNEIKIKFARVLPINEFHSSEEFVDYRQAMDIVLREGPQKSMVGVGRNFFKRDARNTYEMTDQNCSIGFGHHQSILSTEVGLAINVDRVTTIFRTLNVEEPLIEWIKRELKVNSLKDFRFDGRTIQMLSSKLRDMKIYTNHIKIKDMPQKRKTAIECMADIKPYEHKFEIEQGKSVNLVEYFKIKYDVSLEYREIPLLKVKGGTKDNPKYLPVELCHVYPNQSMPKPLITPEMQRQIVESTNTQTPLKRFERIQNSLETVSTESKPLIEKFGLQISPHPIKVLGRQLREPQLIGKFNSLKESVHLEKSLFLNLSPDVANNVNRYFCQFFNDLIATARGMGFRVELPKLVDHKSNLSSTDYRIEVFKKFIKSVPKGTQLVFVCLPYESQLYEMIKHLSENIYGVLTQCIKDNMFMNVRRGYFNNFLLKTNAKLNGQNQALASGQIQYRPKVLTDRTTTMIIGADVTHPGYHNPLANERVISSIAAVVGSYDSDFTKFIASISAEPMNTEFICDFGHMFENLIQKINKEFPKNIIIFRDGVSESQLSLVLMEEIPQIEGVYRKHGLVAPKITAYVVQKRHHIRLLLNKPETDFKGNELFNMKSGTVVDNTITNPKLNEFHLCSHSGRLGTSRHAKYVVIRNDHRFGADQLQMLAYSMCFTYCRSQSPISIPIPVKYADLAAYRAKQHTAAQNNPNAPKSPNFESAPRHRKETEDELKTREARNIRILNDSMKVAEDIVKIPYYC